MSCGFNNYYCRPTSHQCGCEKPVNYCDCSECHRDFKICTNNRCTCSLAEELCKSIDQKVIITIGGCKMQVIVCEVTECILKAINYCTGKVLYFNIDRIDDVETILPRY